MTACLEALRNMDTEKLNEIINKTQEEEREQWADNDDTFLDGA